MIKCPKCQVEYKEAKTSFEQLGVIIPNASCLKCPKCGDEIFTPAQVRAIRERITAIAPQLKLIRKISQAGRRPAIYLPDDLITTLGLSIGDEVAIYTEGKKKIIIEVMK